MRKQAGGLGEKRNLERVKPEGAQRASTGQRMKPLHVSTAYLEPLLKTLCLP